MVIFTSLLYIKFVDKKIDLRANAKQIRRNLDMEKISILLVENLKQNSYYKNAKNVMIFYPTKYEVNLLSLLDDSKKFYLPKVKDKDLLVCPYQKGDKLEKSYFNILEPVSAPVNPEVLDLIVVPALMVDSNGYRLGYGGGFYDRFLSLLMEKSKNFKTVCAIPKELLVKYLPKEKFDISIDIIISV